MNFWEKITGSDMTKELKNFESRVEKLPADYQAAWEEIKRQSLVALRFHRSQPHANS